MYTLYRLIEGLKRHKGAWCNIKNDPDLKNRVSGVQLYHILCLYIYHINLILVVEGSYERHSFEGQSEEHAGGQIYYHYRW